MKKIKFSFLISLLFFFTFHRTVFAQDSWIIHNFNSNISIQSNGVVRITETINADFGASEKHGIFRELPYTYNGDREKVYTKLENINVTRNGSNEKFEEITNGTNLRIKIGDADKTISGLQTYSITYDVMGVLRNYGSYDELYWNSTGNDWEVPIENTTTTIRIPFEGLMQIMCFEGNRGSRNECAFGKVIQ